ncbi:LysR family transcriptional regulator [Xylophilus rhododendri]|uniref:LysR family transcriptional regulator n=1 Tax=Xylophilus rhododendri TaxID=2697032 RepID=A0A857JAJ2_9BURK|nr:LysR substrate-binding domain-containing protein [Xylophilus rhododendri]QHJ00234.1 LysR family transcriptional regulator [Xylophilus rhododendri]
MTDRLPPLNAVRAFVAAARHQSFTRAAVELHVTHSAVSRQVKSLESFLGTALFERRIRQVVLTSAGQAFFAEASAALAQIALAAAAFTRTTAPQAVRVNVRPSFAVRWLIPQLPDFVARHPGIEPQVVTSTAAPGRAKEGFDVAVRRGLQGWPPSIQVQPWLEDGAVVVGSPELLAATPLARAADLSAHVLLSARSRRSDWDDWLAVAGWRRGKPAGRLQFDHLHLVLQAAADGLGLAIAPLSLLGQDLARGRLLAPLPAQRLPLERYYLGLAPDAAPQAAVFVQWLLASPGFASTAA